MVRSGTMQQMQFVQVALFSPILRAAVIVPLAIAEVFEDFALPAGIEINQPLLLVLLREIRKAGIKPLPPVRAKFLTSGLQMDLDSRQARSKCFLQSAPRVTRFRVECRQLLPHADHDGDNAKKV